MKPRPTYIPHQSKISVMDVHNTNTNAGIAMENEEMRRIRVAIDNEVASLVPSAATAAVETISTSLGSPTARPDDIKQSIWALTTEEDTKIIVERVCQDIRFKNKEDQYKYMEFPVKFKLAREPLESKLSTLKDGAMAYRTIIEAKSHVYQRDIQNLIEGRKSIVKVVPDLDGTTYMEFVNDEYYPGAGKFYGTDGSGAKGWQDISAIANISRMELEFDYTTIPVGSSRKNIGSIRANSRVYLVVLIIDEAFDQQCYIDVGDNGSSVRLMNRSMNNTTISNQYHNSPNYKYASSVDLYIYFYTVDALAQGSGTIIIYYT